METPMIRFLPYVFILMAGGLSLAAFLTSAVLS